MCEVLERRIITQDLPYNLEESGGEREIHQRTYETLAAGAI
ncbi:MAG: hypothetical protein WA141_09435 [Methanothrix sp.]